MTPVKALAWVAAAMAFATVAAQEGGPARREDFGRQRDAGSSVAPATARYTAWFELLHLPNWTDRNGTSPKWQEIGPTVIEESWGGSENSGRTTWLVIDPEDKRRMFAGAASGGIWRTLDEAKTWEPVGDHLATLSIGCLSLDPFDRDTLYAGSGEPHYSIDSFHGAGFFRSRDGGRTWDLLASDVFLGYRFTRIVPHPKRPGMLYASTTRGVYRTLDHGATWVKLLDGSASDLMIDPRNPSSLIAGIGHAFGSPLNGVYRSTDSGMTWRKLEREFPHDPRGCGRVQMDQCAAFPEVVYATVYGTSGGLRGLYKTTNFGETWIRLPNAPNYSGDSGWYNNCVGVSQTNPNLIFLGGYTMFKSSDGGETWEDNTKSYEGGPVHPDHHYVTFSPHEANTAFVCTDGGLFRTRDAGVKWESITRGMGTVQFQSVDVHPWDEKIAYGGTQDNGTNKYTGALAWKNIFLGDGGTTRVNWNNPDIVYTEYVNLTICKSTNAGKDWEWNTTNGIDPAEGKLFYAPFNLDPSDPDTLVAGAEKVYRSTDGAAKWKAISPKLGNRVSAVVVAPNLRSVIYAGTSDGKVWVTPNTGKDWYDVTKGLPGGFVNDLCVDPRNARTVYAALGGWTPDRLWKSTDAGGTWTSLATDLPPMPVLAMALHPNRPDTLYIATQVGVFVSEKGDRRWKRFGAGLPNVPVFSIVANRRTGWITIGTHGRGAWRIPLPN